MDILISDSIGGSHEFTSRLNVLNYSYPGRRIVDIDKAERKRIWWLIESNRPQTVTIALGANDFGRQENIFEVLDRLDKLLRVMKGFDIRIKVVTPWPTNHDYGEQVFPLKLYTSGITVCARYMGATVIPAHTWPVNPDHYTLTLYGAPDNVHPNETGLAELAERLKSYY